MVLEGQIQASQIALAKFSISGKLVSVKCKVGDMVKKGQLLASLDKKELQTYLDRSLKQYDLERALFDEKQKENLSEYEKRKYQDSLDISVKNVELAKINLDATNLYASINGIVTQMDNCMPGDNITPAGFVIEIIDPTSLYFQALIPKKDLSQISKEQKCRVKLEAFPVNKYEGVVGNIGFIPIKNGFYEAKINFNISEILKVGLSGTAEF